MCLREEDLMTDYVLMERVRQFRRRVKILLKQNQKVSVSHWWEEWNRIPVPSEMHGPDKCRNYDILKNVLIVLITYFMIPHQNCAREDHIKYDLNNISSIIDYIHVKINKKSKCDVYMIMIVISWYIWWRISREELMFHPPFRLSWWNLKNPKITT